MVLIATAIEVVLVHAYAARVRLSQLVVAYLHFPSTLAALTLLWLFVVQRATPVAQFAVGSADSEAMWSQWMHLWPCLLVAMGVWTVVQCIGVIVTAVARWWHWLLLLFVGAGMSAFGFLTIGALHPTA